MHPLFVSKNFSDYYKCNDSGREGSWEGRLEAGVTYKDHRLCFDRLNGQCLPKPVLWVLSYRHKKVPPPAGTGIKKRLKVSKHHIRAAYTAPSSSLMRSLLYTPQHFEFSKPYFYSIASSASVYSAAVGPSALSVILTGQVSRAFSKCSACAALPMCRSSIAVAFKILEGLA